MTRTFFIALLAAATLLSPGADHASAADAPIPAEAVEKAQALIAASSRLGARHAAETRRRAAQKPPLPADSREDSNVAGFRKFLKLKDLCVEKVPAGEAFDLMLSSFKDWNGGEATPRKAGSCLGAGDYCSSSVWCCGAMACRGGVCGGTGSSCIPRGRACGGSIWCCGTGICNDQGYCQ